MYTHAHAHAHAHTHTHVCYKYLSVFQVCLSIKYMHAF